MSKIFCKTTEQMAEVAASLTRRGIIFNATEDSNGWTIELTGGF